MVNMSKTLESNSLTMPRQISETRAKGTKPRGNRQVADSGVQMLKELFPQWTIDDLKVILAEHNGDLETVISRISEGHAQPFSQVKSKKEVVPVQMPKGRDRTGSVRSRGFGNIQ